MVIGSTESESENRPRFRRWRFGLVTITLIVIGWGFSAAWYCYPEPSLSQQVVFFIILALILIQTVQAGWYIGDAPSEPSDPDAIVFWITTILIVFILSASVIIGFLLQDLRFALFLPVAFGLFFWFVIAVLKGGDPRS